MDEERQLSAGHDRADVLLIGHVTRDVFGDPADHSYRQGGTVSFAALVALGLGRKPSIITRAESPADLAELPEGVDICCLPSYSYNHFSQYLYAPRTHAVLPRRCTTDQRGRHPQPAARSQCSAAGTARAGNSPRGRGCI